MWRKIKTDPKFALDICQRKLYRQDEDSFWNDMYTLWYACCLKDIAYLLFWNDNNYWIDLTSNNK
jgi:hypothetical protein